MTDSTVSNANTTVYLENDGEQPATDLTISTQEATNATLISDVCVIATNDATRGLDSSVIVERPNAGDSYDLFIEPGKKYFIDSAEEDVQSVLRSGDDLTIVFTDGGSVVLKGAAGFEDSDLPATIAFKEEFSIQRFSEFFEVVDTTITQDQVEPEAELRLAESQLEPSETILQSAEEGSNDGGLAAKLAGTEPASGSNTITASNDVALRLADIEPAGGDTGAQGGRGGYGFNSSFTAQGVIGLEDVGPIDPTQLRYGIPQSEFEQLILDPNSIPGIIASNLHNLDETGNNLSAAGTVQVDFGADGPGSIGASGAFDVSGSLNTPGVLTSGGNVVTVTSTPTGYVGTVNGQTVFMLTIDSQTGEYTYNQVLPFDHADGTNPDDVIQLTFGIMASDADGDTVTTDIIINVHDDAPEIDGDVQFLDESDLGPLSVTDTLDHDFNYDGEGSIEPDGNFDATGSVLNGTLTSAGVPVVVAATADGYIGTANGQTIFLLAVDPSTGEYTFTLYGVLDHADPNDPNDVISLNFGVVIMDNDGDTDSDVITINIADSAPSIPNGSPTIGHGLEIVDETDLGPVDVTGTLDVDFGPSGQGMLCTNDQFNASGSLAGGNLTSGGVPVVVTSSPTGYVGTANGQTIFTLTLSNDGTYVFSLIGTLDHADASNPDDVITLTFGVDAKDEDGDSDSGQIIINVNDDGPVAANDTNTVDHHGSNTVTGNVVDNDGYGADGAGFLKEVTFNGNVVSVADGQTVTINGQYGVLTISSDGSYSYTSNGNQNGTDVFGYTICDSDGDTATATLTINAICDDIPVIIAPDVGVVDETDLNPTDEVSGIISVDFGADGPGTIEGNGIFSFGGSATNSQLTSAGAPVVVTQNADGDYIGTANGQTIFTLDIEDDGSYTFTLLGVLDHADTSNPDDVINLFFGVTATDADGDTATTTIQINVHDDGPQIINRWGALEEADLENGPIVITRDINHNYGEDGPGEIEATGVFEALFEVNGQPQPITSGGELVTVTSTSNSYTGTLPNGTVVFTLTIDPVTGQHTYTQYLPIDHVEGANPADDVIWLKFQVQITDNDGDTDTAWIVFDVHDDEPVAVDDVDTTDQNGVATGNVVLPNDNYGADGAGFVKEISFNGNDVQIADGDTVTINGQYGVLTISSDGSYTYTANPNQNGVFSDVFEYTICDADGDTATATLTLNVTCDPDDNPIIITPDIQVVDETDLNPTDEVNGVISVDFGNDGPGTIEGNGSFSFGGSCGNTLTSCGHPVVITQNADGDYIGTANGQTIFTLDIEDDGSFTFTLLGVLDHADTTDHDDVINLFFGVTATDADGDTATTTIQINVHDDGPSLHTHPTLFSTAVDETNLVNGPLVVSRTAAEFSGYHDFGADGPGAITTNDDFIAAFQMGGQNQPLTSGGDLITVTSNGSSYTGTLANGTVVFVFTIDPATGAHTYTQYLPIDHPNTSDPDDIIWLKFGIQIEDCDGDTDTSYIVIDLHDDGPQAVDDVDTTDPNGVATGNVVLPNDNYGADGAGFVKEISFNGNDVQIADGDTVTINGQYGVLTISSDGSYTYTAYPNAMGQDVFEYTICDADGDTATATLTINATCHVDDVPKIGDDKEMVDETFPVPGSGSGGSVVNTTAPGGVLIAHGQLQFDYGNDGPGAITTNNVVSVTDQNGTPIALFSGGALVQIIQTANGYEGVIFTPSTTVFGGVGTITVFTLDLNPDGSYTYTQFLPLDHPDQLDPDDIIQLNFGVQISDSDGDTDDGTITICVNDDGPTAVDDTADASGQGIINGNILINDDFGYDGPGTLKSITVGNTTYNIPTTGDIDITTPYGVLTISANGDYTYVPNASGNAGVDQFTYTICDADGDMSSAAFEITVDGCNPPCWIDVDIIDIVYSWGLTVNGYNIPLNITINTNGVLDYIVVDLNGAFGNNPNVELSAGVEVSPGVWEVQPADIPGLEIELPYVNGPGYDIGNLGGQNGQNLITVTGYTTDGCADTDSTTITLIASPLVLDLDGDGVEHLYYADSDVLFDIDGDGVADDTGWISPDDAFLALDVNGNGTIDDSSELFGNSDIYANGFQALAAYDSNGDGIIDASDSVWSSLIVWQDINQDGVSQANEMFSMEDVGIASISLNSQAVGAFEDNGNYISDTSTFTWDDGTVGVIEDVWFAYTGAADPSASNLDTAINASDVLYAADEDLAIPTTGIASDDFTFGDADFNSSQVLDVLNAMDSADDALQQTIDNFVYSVADDTPMTGGGCYADSSLCTLTVPDPVVDSVNLDDLTQNNSGFIV